MSLIARIIGSIVGDALEKRRIDKHRKINEQLGYEEVTRLVNQNRTNFKHLGIHLLIFFGLIPIFRVLNISEYVLCYGFWAIFVLVPHFFATLLYRERWSSKQLSNMSPSEDYLPEKPKRKTKDV